MSVAESPSSGRGGGVGLESGSCRNVALLNCEQCVQGLYVLMKKVRLVGSLRVHAS